jgi:hypothetical protein
MALQPPRPGAVVVEETRLSVVHAGELIIPAAGSEAELQHAAADPRAVVEYHFPVVIEVREATAPDVDAVAEQAAAKLLSGMWT